MRILHVRYNNIIVMHIHINILWLNNPLKNNDSSAYKYFFQFSTYSKIIILVHMNKLI